MPFGFSGSSYLNSIDPLWLPCPCGVTVQPGERRFHDDPCDGRRSAGQRPVHASHHRGTTATTRDCRYAANRRLKRARALMLCQTSLRWEQRQPQGPHTTPHHPLSLRGTDQMKCARASNSPPCHILTQMPEPSPDVR